MEGVAAQGNSFWYIAHGATKIMGKVDSKQSQPKGGHTESPLGPLLPVFIEAVVTRLFCSNQQVTQGHSRNKVVTPALPVKLAGNIGFSFYHLFL